MTQNPKSKVWKLTFASVEDTDLWFDKFSPFLSKHNPFEWKTPKLQIDDDGN